MMNQPKIQTDDPPAEGTSPDHNPTGNTPHGIPKGTENQAAKALPDNARQASETAPLNTEKT